MRSYPKKVLVTGADGFIGSHLVEMLVARGCDVRAMAQYNSFNHWGWLDNLDCLKDIEVICGDICNPHFCRMAADDCGMVFHLAALIAIPYSYVSPSSYIDTNVKGTFNICQAALDVGCEMFIHTSTSEVYGTAQYVPIDEKHPLQPQSPYSASKIGADAIALSFFNSYQLPVVVARPFNTYGPRQSARAVIPSIIIQIANGKNKILLGDPSPTRDFNYVEDTCAGLVALSRCKKAVGQAVNIGSGIEISIGDTLKMIKAHMNSKVEYIIDKKRFRPNTSEVYRLCCDNSILKSLTGYSPIYTLDVGLRKTIDWFSRKKNLSLYKSEIYNV